MSKNVLPLWYESARSSDNCSLDQDNNSCYRERIRANISGKLLGTILRELRSAIQTFTLKQVFIWNKQNYQFPVHISVGHPVVIHW